MLVVWPYLSITSIWYTHKNNIANANSDGKMVLRKICTSTECVCDAFDVNITGAIWCVRARAIPVVNRVLL